MLSESEKVFLWLVLMIIGAVIISVLVGAFVGAVGAMGYFLTHGGAAFAFIVVAFLIWNKARK
jgi:fucose permease